MVCEARRLGGYLPTAADLAFHRRLVATINASLKERRLTLAERLQALMELQHHQQHQDEIATAIYAGKPMPAEERRLTVSSLSHAPSAATSVRHELPAGTSREPLWSLLRRPQTVEAVKLKGRE